MFDSDNLLTLVVGRSNTFPLGPMRLKFMPLFNASDLWCFSEVIGYRFSPFRSLSSSFLCVEHVCAFQFNIAANERVNKGALMSSILEVFL